MGTGISHRVSGFCVTDYCACDCSFIVRVIRGFASYRVNVAITMPDCAFIYSVTDSRLSYVQQSTLYSIYVHANQTEQSFTTTNLAGATAAARGPELEALSAPVPDILGAVHIGLRVAGGIAARALAPVDVVNLPETNVKGAVAVVVGRVGIATRLRIRNARALGLVPLDGSL